MTVTVRLDPRLRHQLESYCRKHRLTKSRVITELLRTHLSESPAGRKTLYESAQEFRLIGGFSSSRGDLSENYKRYLKDKLRAKHSR